MNNFVILATNIAVGVHYVIGFSFDWDLLANALLQSGACIDV